MTVLPRRRRGSRTVELAFTVYALAVFTLLWGGVVVGLTVGPDPLEEAWHWLSGLPPVPAVIAWIALLPATIGLWAWHADLSGAVAVAVWGGLILWTLIPLVRIGRKAVGRPATAG